MTILAPDIWVKLARARPIGETVVARLAAPESTEYLRAALDSVGRRHFLIEISTDAAVVNDKQSRGIQVETRQLHIPGNSALRYIDIVCSDPAGHDVFQLIGGELASHLERNEDPAESVLRVLAKWRRFWGQLSKDLMSRSEQIGLFAELWFIHAWLIPLFGPRDAVRKWRGPTGSRHDFEWAGVSVETKATTSVHSVVHHVNGLDQLLEPEQGRLFLFSMQLREEAGANSSLPSVVAACKRDVEPDNEAIEEFEVRLLQAGYSAAHEDEYDKLRLRAVKEVLYSVVDDFPRILTRSLVGGCPAGVEYVGYDINLAGFDHRRVDRDALLY